MRSQVLLLKDKRFATIIIPKAGSTAVKWKLWAMAEAAWEPGSVNHCPDPEGPELVYKINSPEAADTENHLAPFYSYKDANALPFQNTSIPLYLVLRDPIARISSVWSEKIASCGQVFGSTHYDYSGNEYTADPHYLSIIDALGLPMGTNIELDDFLKILSCNQEIRESDVHWAPINVLLGDYLLDKVKSGSINVVLSEDIDRFALMLIGKYYKSYISPSKCEYICSQKITAHSAMGGVKYPSLSQELSSLIRQVYKEDYEVLQNAINLSL